MLRNSENGSRIDMMECNVHSNGVVHGLCKVHHKGLENVTIVTIN